MQSLIMANDDTVASFQLSSEDTWYAMLEKFFQGAQALSYFLPYSPGELVEMLEERIEEQRREDRGEGPVDKEDRHD